MVHKNMKVPTLMINEMVKDLTIGMVAAIIRDHLLKI